MHSQVDTRARRYQKLQIVTYRGVQRIANCPTGGLGVVALRVAAVVRQCVPAMSYLEVKASMEELVLNY